jgi:KaiC/GvpD/RAD55 family RecA-like ATPase
MNRVPTGISGFDDLVSGGFPEGRSILLSGSAGTGKTIFALQFLCNGAMKGEPGVLLTLEESPASIREAIKQFGYDVAALEKANKVAIIDASLVRLGLESEEKFTLSPENFNVNHLIAKVIQVARNINAKRVVIDALPSLDMLMGGDKDKVRAAILEVNYLLQANDLTSVLISEIPSGVETFSPHGVEEYVVDGVIVLSLESLGAQSTRTLIIKKMRLTKHSESINSFEIVGNKGITVEASK